MHRDASMKLVSPTRSNLRDVYRAEAERGFERLAHEAPLQKVTEADLERHPPLVLTYLRRVGVVNRLRVRAMRAQMTAEMKMAADQPWMPASADQTSFFDEPTRLFFMEAKRGGIPFHVLHVYRGAHATFEVRVAKLLEVVDARGPEMDRSETVTMFNDLCFVAAPALVDANVRWQEIDARRVRGSFTNAGHTISAELEFDAEGDLVCFVSDDRSMTADGKTYERHRWMTPLGGYREIDGFRVPTTGEAIWRLPQGDFAYARIGVTELSFAPVPEGRVARRVAS
jgi:hypothetical protein